MCNKASESNFEPSVDNKIYLVERLSELSGFFNHNGNKLFIVFNANHDKPNSIRTNLLEMDTHVYINSIENGKQKNDDVWYDLQGRRIGQGSMANGQLKPGLYIVNGKKVIIK